MMNFKRHRTMNLVFENRKSSRLLN